DPSGVLDSTEAVQRAIDAASAAGGGIVFFPAGRYHFEGTLLIRHDRIVLRGEGPQASRLSFTRFAGMTGKSHITFQGDVEEGADILLVEDGIDRATFVEVADATSLAVGDDIAVGWVITDDFVEEHGMSLSWQAFNGTWRPFFRRRVVGLDLASTPHRVFLDVPLRYPAKTRDFASIRKETGYLSEVGIESLGVANAVGWEDAWSELRVHVIDLIGVKDGWVRDVASFPAPDPAAQGYHLQSGGIRVLASKRVTVADCVMEKAQNRGGGGCGYLYEISKSNEILVRDSVGRDGRHNFIQNWDFGTTGCVFLRCSSAGSRTFASISDPVGTPAYNEYHHSLAMANLVDRCHLEDGWYGGNRDGASSGAGHTVTQSVYWNTSGGGEILSWQYGWGYVIGTTDMAVVTLLGPPRSAGTAPADYVEGENRGATLDPPSLFEDQLQRRLSLPEGSQSLP
ncbi:MAG: hypothetical protein D6795_06825, partial [Deltaproteobacteria bacterium]